MNSEKILKIVRRAPYASLFLTLLAVMIHWHYVLRQGLLYDRDALARLEVWRLVTCHWVHLNGDHR